MQQRQLGGALRFHVRCYYRPDAAAPTEAWPTDLAGNITGARCTGSTHPATTRLQWTAEGGSPRRPAPSGARRIIPSGAAAPAASRPRVRLRSARPDERVTAFGLDEVGVDRCREGGIRRASPRDTEIHRVLLRGSLPSGTDFRRFGRQTAFDQPRVCAGPAMRDEARRWAALTRTLPRRAHPSISTCCRK